jgi:AsmA protein
VKYPRIRLGRLLLALVLIPLGLWGLILALVPTAWVKDRLVARLSRATGKPVRLAAVHLGPCGGVHLRGLEIGETGHEDDPWLRVDQIGLDLHLYHLLCSRLDPTEIEADGVVLRIHRRQDGTFEFGDLLGQAPTPTPQPVSSEGNTSCAGMPLDFRVAGGRITIIDEPSATRLEFSDLEGQATWRSGRATIKDLKGKLNGGRIELAAQFDRSGPVPAFDGEVRTEGVALDVGMGVLAYLAPVLAGTPGSVDGKLDLHVYAKGQGASGAELARSLAGKGTIALDPIRLDDSKFVAELAGVLPMPPTDRVGSVKSQFTLGDGRVTSDPLTLTVGRLPIALAGWTGFDGRLDYRITRQEGLTGRLPREARQFLADLPVKVDDLASVHVHGTLDALTVSVDAPTAADRERLKQAGREALDKLLPDSDGGTSPRPENDRERLKQLGRKALDRFLK